MIVRERAAELGTSMSKDILRAVAGRSPALRAALRYLFRNHEGMASFQDLRLPPTLASHRNPVKEPPFLLPRKRFGGAEDVPIIPLLRKVVDQTLRAYAYSFPYLLEAVGKTPISAHGSMALSVTRWGHVDWDYVRDIDIRIFLPPQLGHLSGFKTDLSKALTRELHERGLRPLLLGKDECGRPQVQLRDLRTQAVHGFHLFLIAMKPGFVRAKLHRDGGYSPHYAYFPDGSIDEHLEAAGMMWPDVIRRQTEDYIEMFNQLSFNIFGEDVGKAGRLKTPGWYLRKAFKWYATLARMRGLMDLEEDLLYQFDHFQSSEEEFSYLARYRYYARMAPNRLRMEDLQRDLARVDSFVYATARSPKDSWVGKAVTQDGLNITLLESAPADFSVAAWKLLEKEGLPSLRQAAGSRQPARVRFADNLAIPSVMYLDEGEPSVLIPSEWSMVFDESYVRRMWASAKAKGKDFAPEDARHVVVAVLASLLHQALVARQPQLIVRNS